MTTWQVAELLYPDRAAAVAETPAPEAKSRARRRLVADARKQVRVRWGLEPLPGRADDGQLRWDRTAVLAARDAAPGAGAPGVPGRRASGLTRRWQARTDHLQTEE